MARMRWTVIAGAAVLMVIAPLMTIDLTGVPAAAATLQSGCAQATPRGIITCTYTTPGQSMFDVPEGVTEVTVTAIGAPGGAGGVLSGSDIKGGAGGLGAEVTATPPVTPSSVLYVEVGGPGGNGVANNQGNVCPAGAAGVNGGGAGGVARCDTGGGGGGGGESDVQTVPVASEHLTGTAGDPRLVVAGGGGGGGGNSNTDGGAGGNAGVASVTGAGNGGNAGTCTGISSGAPGAAGGYGGGGGAGGGPSCLFTPYTPGSAGSPTAGGTGGNGDTADSSGGGGGGGGYMGGGGGGALVPTGGGGGGGSSYALGEKMPPTTAPAGTAASVTITYTPAPLPQAISFTAPSTGVVGATATFTATGGGSGNPVVVSATTTSVCVASGLDGATVRYLAAGTCTLEANETGGDGYAPAAPVERSITVDETPPAIPPKPVVLTTGPPEAPAGRSPLLPIGIGMVALGTGGMTIEEILRRCTRHRS